MKPKWLPGKGPKRLGLFISLVVCLLLVGSPVATALAQTYEFSVPELRLQAFVQPDASVRLIYDITFQNFGSPIDIVDIGLPHEDYDIGTMTASINGVSLNDIRTSEYIDIGVEVHLGNQAIPRGEQGTLHFEATMPDMVYEDTTDRSNASFQITPTWFDKSLVRGQSIVRIAIHLPEGVEPDEAKYQNEPFSVKAIFEDHTVVAWEWENVPATQPYLVGVSFPQDVMTRVIKMSFIDLVVKWLEDNPQTRFFLGLVGFALFAFLFFRFSGGTGLTVFVILAGGMVFIFVVSILSPLLFIPALIVLIIVNETKLRKRKKSYLPPIAQTEGGGIKRGLTAPEAAVLLEMPLNKILTLVIFGMLEKHILDLVDQDPLTVKVAAPFRTWHDPDNRRSSKARRKARRRAAQDQGTVVHAYEEPFLDQLERTPDKPVSQVDFTKPVERLIKATAAKMEAFDLSDTQDYYRRVIDRAMKQAETIGEVEQQEQYLDKYLPWVMMNDNYPTVLNRGGYHYWPMWARPMRSRTFSTGGSGRAASGGPASGGPARGGRTSFGDVAASFSGWAEATMGGMAAAILPNSMNMPTTKGGFVNLSGVDRVTGDVFEALAKASSSSGGGGGSSGGSSCACACAGCACACACAGGGR